MKKVQVVIQIGQSYIKDLEKRLQAAEPPITHADLGRAAKIGKTQMSRWFTANEERRLQPSLRNVERLEKGLAKLLAQREKSNQAGAP